MSTYVVKIVMPGVDDEIDRMKAALGVEIDRDLANALSIDPTAVAAWRRRGKVPEKYRVRYLRTNDERAASHLSSTSVGIREAYIFALVAVASNRLSDQVLFGGPDSEDFTLAWIGYRMAEFYERLNAKLNAKQDKDELRRAFENIRGELSGSENVEVWLSTFG